MLLLNALLPKRCPLCAARSSQGICADCRPLLPWIVTACEICGAALPDEVGVGICGGCQAEPPHYDHAVIPFAYRAPVSNQIQALKYRHQLRYAGALGAMICAHAWQDPSAAPDVLIPVPLHRKRLQQRGFNQSLEIARRVGKELGIEVNHSLLARIKNTVSQTQLSAAQRRRNVRGAFKAAGIPENARVALVDDVVTSGSTANAAAHALKIAGVETVSVWAAAKAS